MKDGTNKAEVSLDDFTWDPETMFDQTIKVGGKSNDEEMTDDEILTAIVGGEAPEEPSKEESEEDSGRTVEETTEEAEEEAEAATTDVPDDKAKWKALALDLQDRGYDFGFSEDDEVGEREFYEGITSFVGNAVEGAIEEWRGGFDGETQNFIRYVQNGGTPEDYYQMSGVGSWRSYDISTEDGAEGLVRHYLQTVDKADKDTIDEEVEVLIDSGLLEKKAAVYDKRLRAKSENEKKEHLAAVERQREAQKAAEAERLSQLKQASKKIESVKGIKIKGEDIYDYLTRPTEKVGSNYVSPFYRDLQSVISESPEKLFLLGHLLRSDFDFGAIERAAETKAARRTADLIKGSKEATATGTGRGEKRPFWEVGKF